VKGRDPGCYNCVMQTSILATKLYLPSPRPQAVPRPRLIERLNEGLRQEPGFGRPLTLLSAPAGFGKTTLLSEWLHDPGVTVDAQRSAGRAEVAPPQASIQNPPSKIVNRVAWLSLDAEDDDPARLVTYVVTALQTVAPNVGAGVLVALQSSQPPPAQVLLTALLNEIAALANPVLLVLDDCHVLEAEAVMQALAFLLEHLPSQMHLVLATREDPPLPLARLRARGQMVELRAGDLRFTPDEAADFLNRVMGLGLSAEDVAILESRTEGWIAGLQLAALALRGMVSTPGRPDTAGFIQSFTGSHRFVLDYLVEEVLSRQPVEIQDFMLKTSILERMTAGLCGALLQPPIPNLQLPGSDLQPLLDHLDRANLFLVPLDNERRWYRYHHLFGELLRQRLRQRLAPGEIARLHIRASEWYENNGLVFEAFRHATAANDVARAERLTNAEGMPIHFRGVAAAVLDWLASLPSTVLDARPTLWVKWATLSLVIGQTTGVEERLQAAEAALPRGEPDGQTRNLLGIIAAARATLALTRYEPEAMMSQARRALDYLHPDNLTFRFTAFWVLSYAHLFLGDRAAARAAAEAMSTSQASGDPFSTILARGVLGQVQELENQLYLAAETYRHALELEGDPPLPNAAEAHLGLARIFYQWNDLDAAARHGRQSLHLAHQYDQGIDRFILAEVFLARLKLAQGDVGGAAAALAQTEESVRRNNFSHRLPEVAAAQVLVLLHQGKLEAAARLAQTYHLPLEQARVFLAQGEPVAALAALEPLRRQAEEKGWADERLKALVLQSVALHAHGEKDQSIQVLGAALGLAEPGGFVRLFLDEGTPMRQLLQETVFRGIASDYARRLLAAFAPPGPKRVPQSALVEPLSERELEVLQLIAKGFRNRQIADRLYLSINTVKVHARNIYGKLGVNNRTEAVARARELGVLPQR